ncbi:uncharacterized protein AAG666_016998 [Megaptera novaeangliae]
MEVRRERGGDALPGSVWMQMHKCSQGPESPVPRQPQEMFAGGKARTEVTLLLWNQEIPGEKDHFDPSRLPWAQTTFYVRHVPLHPFCPPDPSSQAQLQEPSFHPVFEAVVARRGPCCLCCCQCPC